MMEFNIEANVEGVAGPARTQAEADADQAAGLAAMDEKRARLAELRSQFEGAGYSPERAQTMATSAYAAEQG